MQEQPVALLGEPLWNQMVAAYRDWVLTDHYRSRYSRFESSTNAGSVRELLGRILAAGARQRFWRVAADATEPQRLHMPLRQLMDITTRNETGTQLRLEELFFRELALAPLEELLQECSVYVSSDAGRAEHQALIVGAGCQTWNQVTTRVQTVSELVARGLFEVFLRENGAKPLLAFFTTQVRDDGYRAWFPRAHTGLGRPLKPLLTVSASGSVTVEVSRYEETGSNVRAYEWSAELRLNPGNPLPDAVACGMVYVLQRADGMLYSSPSDLRWAADAVADADVAQVLAFLRQHSDAPDLMEQGDLGFVWLWERRAGTPAGIGRELLDIALQDLKRRFRTLRTLVINLQPAQYFEDVLDSDPAELQVARQRACEKLEDTIRNGTPQAHFNGVLRFIVRQTLSPTGTLAALGAADIADDEF